MDVMASIAVRLSVEDLWLMVSNINDMLDNVATAKAAKAAKKIA